MLTIKDSLHIMELQNAMISVLKETGCPLTCPAIAEKINARNLYKRGDGGPLKGGQISARISKYPHLFKKDKTHTPMLISLNE